MTNEEARKILDSSFVWQKMVDEECEALGMAIKALEQEPCEDAISRHTVFTMIFDNKSYFKNDFAQGFFADKIMDLPSVTPQPTRWIPVSERLPEKPYNYPYCGIYRTYFLVSLASGCVKTLGYEFDRDEWQVTGSPVIAWMPLPEPYVPDTNVEKMAESEDKE